MQAPAHPCSLPNPLPPLPPPPSQAIGLLDDLDKELNTYAMRVREWYGWHFPEMTKIVTDNIAYAKTGACLARPVDAGVVAGPAPTCWLPDGARPAAALSRSSQRQQLAPALAAHPVPAAPPTPAVQSS